MSFAVILTIGCFIVLVGVVSYAAQALSATANEMSDRICENQTPTVTVDPNAEPSSLGDVLSEVLSTPETGEGPSEDMDAIMRRMYPDCMYDGGIRPPIPMPPSAWNSVHLPGDAFDPHRF